jgi:mRNA-degrading endonuclease RelE of RelBE toxin-antitoxin system
VTSHKLIYSPEAKAGIEGLPTANLKKIAERVLVDIAENPFRGKKLVGRLDRLHSARITRRYRVVYHIDTSHHTVFILDVTHRKESYRR